jgi:drug/metabolite transporter (DMT)-like permease
MTDVHDPDVTGGSSGRSFDAAARRSTGIRLALLTAVISGVAVWVNGKAVGHFSSPTVYTTAKNLVAAAALGALLIGATRARSAEGWTPPTTTRQRIGLLAVGVIGGALPFVLFFEGLVRAGSTDAAFVHKTLVLWVALLAVPLLGERLGPRHIAAIGLVLWGQAELGGGIAVGADRGVMLIAAATSCWAVEVIVAKRLLADLSPLTVGTARMGIGAVLLVVWTVATLGSELVLFDAGQVAWLLITGALLTGYVATWYSALSRAPAVDVTAVLVLGALITALLGAVVDDAAIGPLVPGLALLAAGAALMVGRPRRDRVPAS